MRKKLLALLCSITVFVQIFAVSMPFAYSAGELPAGWANKDIGGVAAAGTAEHNNGVYTVKGSGADVWGGGDEFQYAYRQVTGDCTIIARVASIQNTNSWAKAGVMIRDTLDANSINAFLAATPSSGITYQYRTTKGGSTTSAKVTGTAPVYLKLVKQGSSVTSYHSIDRVTWIQVGAPQTIATSSVYYIGLAVTSHADGTLCTATFDNVDIQAAKLEPHSISISGLDAIKILDTDKIYQYTAAVKDAGNVDIVNEQVTWSLVSLVGGVAVDANTGAVSIASTAGQGTVEIKASVTSKPEVFAIKSIELYKFSLNRYKEFVLKDHIGHSWEKQIVSYDVSFNQGEASASSLSLQFENPEDGNLQDYPFQVSDITYYADTSVKTAKVSFLTDLPKLSTKKYRLFYGIGSFTPPNFTSNLSTTSIDADTLEVNTGKIKMRIADGSATYPGEQLPAMYPCLFRECWE